MIKIPRMVIAGTNSGSGKTTFSIGLMAALNRRGKKVAPFKVGPDYIDPSYHSKIVNARSRNLDAWMVESTVVAGLFAKSAAAADIAVVEGVMGMYDGYEGNSEAGSTAAIAKLIKAPVFLVINGRGMSRSAAAMALGFKMFDPDVNVAGVLFNNIGGERHYKWLKEAVEDKTGVPVVGYLPRDERLVLPSRHLGLIPAEEMKVDDEFYDYLAESIEKYVDIDRMVEISSNLPELAEWKKASIDKNDRIKIAVARDEAFTFYYEDNFDLLDELGADIIEFSPLRDKMLPDDVDGVYIGGGFPEVFAGELSSNSSMLVSVKNAIDAGVPVFAECGGFMYLAGKIISVDGIEYPMVGVVSGYIQMQNKLASMGYRVAECIGDNLLAKSGTIIRGHEFHYSTFVPEQPQTPAFVSKRPNSDKSELSGVSADNLLATYLHIHFYSDTKLAKNYVRRCKEYSKKRKSI